MKTLEIKTRKNNTTDKPEEFPRNHGNSNQILDMSCELSGKFSDKYGFLDADSSAKGNDPGLQHNFDFIGNANFQNRNQQNQCFSRDGD